MGSDITETIAQALQTPSAELEKIVGTHREIVDLEKLSQHEQFKDRVLSCNPSDFKLPKKFGDTRPWPSAHRIFFIDNSNGKVGEGDLLVQTYESKYGFALGLFEIFGPPNIRMVSKLSQAMWESGWNASSDTKKTLRQIRVRKGQSIKNLKPLLKERCRELLRLPDLPKNKSSKEKYDALNVE